MRLIERILENEYVRLEPLEGIHRERLRRQQVPTRKSGHCSILFGQVCRTHIVYQTEAANRCVDIGSTYYRPEFRGGVVNPAANHLLLGHAFASGANHVQFGVDALNVRSRAAMRRLGATEEVVLRRARIARTGRVYDRVIFSVLSDEWPRVTANLEEQLAHRSRVK